MAIFFLGWDLWQDMTFVLACLIAIVFAIAFAKLWLTNRILRRHELLDEEKQERLSEMRQCGIPIPRVNEIPFGVRAIQSGIEVDGIWISRPNTPDDSRRTSCATLPVEGALLKPATATASNEQTAIKHHGTFANTKAKRSSLGVMEPLSNASNDTEPPDALGTSRAVPPTAGISAGQKAESNARPANTRSRSEGHLKTTRSGQEPSAEGPRSRNETSGHGSAEVYVNTSSRRTTTGFEILPAGALGDRVELRKDAYHDGNDARAPVEKKEARKPQNKLQKPRPKPAA